MKLQAQAAELFRNRQQEICAALTSLDGKEQFCSDYWERPEGATFGSGGGGLTRVLRNGAVFESAGVNFSEVQGSLPAQMVRVMTGEEGERPFYATGVSLVLHPFSPMVPTVHANFRFLQVGEKAWFGGGADLTPYYLFEEDAVHFHRVWQHACGEERYRDFKKQCDSYFYLPHREEARGIGGIFYDYLGREEPEHLEAYFSMSEQVSAAFLESYVPIVERRKNGAWGEAEKRFQLLRRGRYVEFNLVYDRGTTFGLQTKGRTESILMSLPPHVAWEYQFQPEAGSRESALLDVLREPRDWV